jgi:hypothetical protein
MNIGLIDVDGKIANLALMKISAWHKAQGDEVKWHDPLFDRPDRVYASKIFTFSPDYDGGFPDCEIIRGGTGYDINGKLPPEIEAVNPDYSIYPNCNYAIGFLTRGCIRSCSWCVVPQKEGNIHAVATWQQIKRNDCNDIMFLDNNVLASEHGIKQIEELGKTKVKIDFNQGLDARLIDSSVARLLCDCKWSRYIRISCDTISMLNHVKKAVQYIKAIKPKIEIFCYVLVKEVAESLSIVEELRALKVTPFAQPFRDFKHNNEIITEQRNFARWVNRREIFKTCSFENYRH